MSRFDRTVFSCNSSFCSSRHRPRIFSPLICCFFVESPNHYLIRCLTTTGNGTYYGSPLNLQSILLHRHPQSLCRKLCILVLWDPRRLLLPRYTSGTWLCSHLPTRVFQRRLSVLPISRIKFSPVSSSLHPSVLHIEDRRSRR